MKTKLRFEDFEQSRSIIIQRKDENYIEVELKDGNLSAKKVVYLYTDFSTLITFLKNSSREIQSRDEATNIWESVEEDFTLTTSLARTGKAHLKAELRDAEKQWAASLTITVPSYIFEEI
ncbi:MAG: DUF6228 family protein [Bdellovibrionales bacterium]